MSKSVQTPLARGTLLLAIFITYWSQDRILPLLSKSCLNSCTILMSLVALWFGFVPPRPCLFMHFLMLIWARDSNHRWSTRAYVIFSSLSSKKEKVYSLLLGWSWVLCHCLSYFHTISPQWFTVTISAPFIFVHIQIFLLWNEAYCQWLWLSLPMINLLMHLKNQDWCLPMTTFLRGFDKIIKIFDIIFAFVFVIIYSRMVSRSYN